MAHHGSGIVHCNFSHNSKAFWHEFLSIRLKSIQQFSRASWKKKCDAGYCQILPFLHYSSPDSARRPTPIPLEHRILVRQPLFSQIEHFLLFTTYATVHIYFSFSFSTIAMPAFRSWHWSHLWTRCLSVRTPATPPSGLAATPRGASVSTFGTSTSSW